MVARIVLILFLAVGVMAAVKSGTILRGFGVLATCETLETAEGQPTSWQACRDGILDGRRDLSDSCESQGFLKDGREYWSCPTPPPTATAPAVS